MTSLKQQIEENIRKKRERSGKLRRIEYADADEARQRFDDIRPKLDELSHTTDNYSVKVVYAKGPYSATIAVMELYDINETWVASWKISTTVSDSVCDWQVAYDPHGVATQNKWFANSDDLFEYLTTSIAERVVQMEAAEG